VERAAFVLTVRPGKEEAYRDEHTRVWPELIEEARSCGVRNQTVYLHGRTIFVYMEASDIEQCLSRLAVAPVNARWDKFMDAFIEPHSVRLADVFHMD
jgi:L-rhamnose mutarotase